MTSYVNDDFGNLSGTLPEGVQWASVEHRLLIVKGKRGDNVPPHRILYSANYVVLNDNGTFIIVKNRTGDLEFLRKLLSDELQVKFVIGNNALNLAEREDLAILRLKGLL